MKQNMNPTWTIHLKNVDFGAPTSFRDHVYFGCTQRERQIRKNILDNFSEICLNPRFLLVQKKTYQFLRNRMPIFHHGLVTWKVMPRNVWKDFATWQTKQRNNFSKSQHHALTTTTSDEKNGICWRSAKCLLADGSETYWET